MKEHSVRRYPANRFESISAAPCRFGADPMCYSSAPSIVQNIRLCSACQSRIDSVSTKDRRIRQQPLVSHVSQRGTNEERRRAMISIA